MNIDKVILCVDNNQNYTCYWNVVADVWINKYKIEPILVFVGSESELKNNDFKYKEKIIRVDKLNYPVCHITWSIFWATQFFENETCLITGIDQIPLSNFFIESISGISNEKYVVGLSDCYEGYTKDTLGYFNTSTNVLYPSSHHVAKGRMFKKIFELNKDWNEESNNLISSSDRYYLSQNMWGIDECYSSEKISLFDQSEIEYLKIGRSWFLKNRIYLGSTRYNILDISKGVYSEATYKPCYAYANEVANIIKEII